MGMIGQAINLRNDVYKETKQRSKLAVGYLHYAYVLILNNL